MSPIIDCVLRSNLLSVDAALAPGALSPGTCDVLDTMMADPAAARLVEPRWVCNPTVTPARASKPLVLSTSMATPAKRHHGFPAEVINAGSAPRDSSLGRPFLACERLTTVATPRGRSSNYCVRLGAIHPWAKIWSLSRRRRIIRRL